jgi:DNA-directed RNA polymerase subunit RPC12/RpoP
MSGDIRNTKMSFQCPYCAGRGLIHVKGPDGKGFFPVHCPKCGARISVVHGDEVTIQADVTGDSADDVATVMREVVGTSPSSSSQKRSSDVSALPGGRTNKMPRVFICHSSRDKSFVRDLVSRLQDDGIETWFDEVEIKIGDSIHRKINDGLKKTDFFAIVLSKASVKSRWVQEEVSSESSMEKLSASGIFVLPILLETCEVPPLLLDRRYANFRDDPESAYSELVDAIYKHFTDRHPEVVVEQLASPTIDETFTHVAQQYPEKLYEIPPREFEELVASIFRKQFGYQTELTPLTRDGGYDVVLHRDIAPGLSPERVIVQCKRYRKPVGVATVRELLGTLLREGADRGILVTTSSFTAPALKEVKGQRIDMVDAATLREWLGGQTKEKAEETDDG